MRLDQLGHLVVDRALCSHLRGDLLDRVDDGGVVAPAELAAIAG